MDENSTPSSILGLSQREVAIQCQPSWSSALQIDTFCIFQTDVARDAFTYTSLPVVPPCSIYAQLLSVKYGLDIAVVLLSVGILLYRCDEREG